VLLHDYLLTGNPFYWLTVADAYTVLARPGLQPISVLAYVHDLVTRYGGMLPLVLLALVGLAYLVTTRRWALLVGIAGLIGGVLVLLGGFAIRGTFISARYYEEPGLGLILLAGVGIGGIVSLIAGRLPRPSLAVGARGAGVIAAVVLGVVLSLPGPLTSQLESRFSIQQTASADLEAVMPRLRQILEAVRRPAPSAAPAKKGFTVVDPKRATAYVPRALQRRIAIELNVSLTMLADPTAAALIARPERLLVAGQYVYHDINVDVPRDWFSGLEVTKEKPLGKLRVVPLSYKPGTYWLVQVRAPAP
jgi:hypothetical protein